MSHQSALIATDIHQYLVQHERKELLRFITCGSVDDGKSTLIGRLFFEAKMIYEDQLAAITKESTKFGTTGDEIDLALFTDGLEDERQQGITIDVAYRYFSTDKMDLVSYSQDTYDKIRADYQGFAARLDLPDVHFLPLSALKGDNVVVQSPNTPWYNGPTLMHLLETVYIGSDRNLEDFRFPVQSVLRPNLDFRGFSGTIASGIVRKGDEILALPSRKASRVKSI